MRGMGSELGISISEASLRGKLSKAAGDRDVFDIKATIGSTPVTTLDGTVVLTLQYEPGKRDKIANLAIYHMGDDGKMTKVGGYYADGAVSAPLSHLSYYLVSDGTFGKDVVVVEDDDDDILDILNRRSNAPVSSSSNLTLMVAVAAAAVCVGVLAVAMFLRRD